MPKITGPAWLAFAVAACSLDSRNPGTFSNPAQSGALVDTSRPGAQPSVASMQQQTLPAATPPSSSGQDEPGIANPATARLSACTDETVGFDALFQLARADLLQQPPEARTSARYVSLTNQSKIASCAAQLEEKRAALAKGLNMLSLNTRVTAPTAINAERTIYRIDLRDYAWNRALQVAGQSFGDVWQAITAADPFAVAFTGRDADALAAGTGTSIPILFADHLLSAGTAPPLYFAILGADASAPVGDFILGNLGIDLAANLRDGRSLRAGTTHSGGFSPGIGVIVERMALGARSGALWRVLLPDVTGTFALQDLLGLPTTDGEAIFSLPNGMLGFLSFDRTGQLLAGPDTLSNTILPAQQTASCSACHSDGLLPVVDEAKAAALANAPSAGLTGEEVAQLQATYVEPDVFARTAAQDSAAYQGALQLLGLPPTGTDPVSSVVFRLERELPLAVAAGELGLTAADLSANLDLLDPELRVLAGGGLVSRVDFTAVFVESLCLLSTNLENLPDPAACNAAAAR